MMVVEDKEEMGLATGGITLVPLPVYFQTHQHTTIAHGWAKQGFILIFGSFLPLSTAEQEGRSHPSD